MSLNRILSQALVERHPARAARRLERLEPEHAAAALEQFDRESAARVLQCMETAIGANCLAAWPTGRLGPPIEALAPDHAARMLSRLEPATRNRILSGTARDAADPLRLLLERREGTAGALMDPRPPTLPADMTVVEARARVQSGTRDLLYYLYLVDPAHRLVGVLNLRQLLLAPADSTIATMMRSPVKRISADTGWESVVAHPGWSEFHAMPVVDRDDVLIGVLRYETLRRLEADAGSRPAAGVLELGLAVGEVYWEVATGLLQETLDLAAGTLARTREARTHHGN